MSKDYAGAVEGRAFRLPAGTRVYENMASAAGGLVVVAMAWVAVHQLVPSPWGFRVALGMTFAAVLGVSADLVVNEFQQRHFMLEVLPSGVEITRGRYVTTTVSLIPGAVISVDVLAGPLLRRLGLARLRLNGVVHLPEIPPLSVADAHAVRALMVERMVIPRAIHDGNGVP